MWGLKPAPGKNRYTTMVRWIILIIVVYLAYRFLKGFLFPPKIARREPPKEIKDEMVQDPVCQVYIPKGQAIVMSNPDGTVEYFCSAKCRDAYKREYAKKGSSRAR